MYMFKKQLFIILGQEMLPKYVRLLLNCECEEKYIKDKNLAALVAWKDSRRAFWSTSTSGISLSSYCEGTIGEIFLESSKVTVSENSLEYSDLTLPISEESDNFYRELLGLAPVKPLSSAVEESQNDESKESSKENNSDSEEKEEKEKENEQIDKN